MAAARAATAAAVPSGQATGSRSAAWRVRRHRWIAMGLLAGLVAAVALTGCTGGDDALREAVDGIGGGSADEQGAPMTSDDAARAEGEVAAEEPGADAVQPAVPTQGDSGGRAVIRTGTMHIRATDTAAVAEQVVVVVEDAGGYVSGTDLTRDEDGVVTGSFTFRVPSSELQATMDAFDGLADAVLERRLDEVDITTQLTDLEAELTNLEAYETELRELLTEVREAGADTEELLRVFDRLNAVRAQIDQAVARRTQLEDQVTLSTIHLRLSPTASTGPVTDPGWDPGGTARAALATTVRALTGLADSLIRIGLTVLPVTLVVAAPLLLVALLARRWWRRRHGATAEATAAERTPPDGASAEPAGEAGVSSDTEVEPQRPAAERNADAAGPGPTDGGSTPPLPPER